MKAGSVLLALLLLSATAHAAASATPAIAAWQVHYDQALQHYAMRDFTAAEASARQALSAARQGQGGTHPFVASSLNALALVRQAQGQPAEAAELLREALALSEAALGAHANTASLAFNLGQALEGLARPQEALAHYGRSLAITEGLAGDPAAAPLREKAKAALERLRATTSAEAFAQQARELQAQGQAAFAREALVQALAIREARDPRDPALAELFNELALSHLAQKEFAPAEARLERALALVVRHRGAQSLEAARLVGTQALLQGERGDEARAQALHQQALSIYQQHGDEPEALLGQAQALNHLAGFVYRKRRLQEAEPMFLRALALTEQALGPQDVRLLPLLDNLQALYRSQGRRQEALAYERRAAPLRQPAVNGSVVQELPP